MSLSMIDIETLKNFFKDYAEKSNLTFKGKCSVCGIDVVVEVIPCSGGFGLQGGVLFEFNPDVYFAMCPNCYKTHPKINDNFKPKYNCVIVK